MNQMCFKVLKIAVAAITIIECATVSAQTAGTWSFVASGTKVSPNTTSGSISAPASPGSTTAMGSLGKSYIPVVYGSYMFSDNISVEGNFALPYKSDFVGAGAISGTGRLGTTEAIAPTVTAQYRFLETSATFRPYVGLGFNYMYFQKETGTGALTAVTNPGGPPTTFKMDDAIGLAYQIGATYALTDKWFINGGITKSYLRTTVHFSTGQTVDLKLAPLYVSLGIGYHF